MSKRASVTQYFFARTTDNSNRKDPADHRGEITREVKCNANIQPVSKKRTRNIR